MAAPTKQQKVNKEMAEMLLRVQGQDYYKWLDEKHVEVISKGTDTMRKLSELATSNVLAKNNHNNESEGEVV